MKPVGRRKAARHLIAAFQMSERHACRLIGLARSSMRYQVRPDRNGPLRAKLRELAAYRPRFGYRRLQALLEREGLRVNHKRVYRVRLNGADHQWGKDPPKEVVG